MNDLDLNDQKGAFLEKMLLSICDHRGADWRRMMFVVRYRNRRVRVGRPHVLQVPIRVWRAFYARCPDRMLGARMVEVVELARQFKAENDAAAANASFDAALAKRGIATTSPK